MANIYALLRDVLQESLDSVCVLSGIILLNTPALVCRAEPSSILYEMRTKAPFSGISMSTLDSECSFSPKNLKEGKWHTLVTSLFNHSGIGHLFGNVLVLSFATGPVIRLTGIPHFCALYMGAGVVGNFALLLQYIVQRSLWRETAPDVGGLWLLGDSLEHLKRSSMTSLYNRINEWRPIVGASGCVSGILGFYSCVLCTRIWRYLRRKGKDNGKQVCIFKGTRYTVVSDVGLVLMRDALLIGYALSQFQHDVFFFINDFKNASRSMIQGAIAYSPDGVGHGSHFGGFLFGVLYFLCLRKKVILKIDEANKQSMI